MKPNHELIAQSYRNEIEKLLPSNEDDIMLVLMRSKQSGKRLFEIKRPKTTLFGGLISIENPIFNDIIFVGSYPHDGGEISVFIGKDGGRVFFMKGGHGKDKKV